MDSLLPPSSESESITPLLDDDTSSTSTISGDADTLTIDYIYMYRVYI